MRPACFRVSGISGIDPSAFGLQRVDGQGGAGEAVPFKLVIDGMEASSALRGQEIWLAPLGRLALGSKVRVVVRPVLKDADGEANDPDQWDVTVRSAEDVGAVQSGVLQDMVVHASKLSGAVKAYAVEKLGESLPDSNWDTPGKPIQALRVFDVTDPNQPKAGALFGAHGALRPQPAAAYATLEEKPPGEILKDGYGNEIPYEAFFLQEIRVFLLNIQNAPIFHRGRQGSSQVSDPCGVPTELCEINSFAL